MNDSLDIIVRGDGYALIVIHREKATEMWIEQLASVRDMHDLYTLRWVSWTNIPRGEV